MDARQPVPEGIRGVDVDDMRSCLCDSLPLLVRGMAITPRLPDNHGQPGFPSSRCCCQGPHTLLPHAAAVQLHRCVARGEGKGKGREAVCRLMLTGQPKICFVRSKLAPSTPGQERFNPAGATLAGISRGPQWRIEIASSRKRANGPARLDRGTRVPRAGDFGRGKQGVLFTERQGDRRSHGKVKEEKGKICPLVSPSLGRLLLLLSPSNTLRVLRAFSRAFRSRPDRGSE